MPSRDVNAVTRLAEASWRRDKSLNHDRYFQKYHTMVDKNRKLLILEKKCKLISRILKKNISYIKKKMYEFSL